MCNLCSINHHADDEDDDTLDELDENFGCCANHANHQATYPSDVDDMQDKAFKPVSVGSSF